MRSIFQCDPRGGHNRYKCNFDFFKKWTNEMAYVLGFLYADGAVIDAISSRTQYIQFNSTDKELLEKIKIALNSEHPIRVLPPHLTVHKNGTYKSAKSFILRIGSRRMFNDLIRLGVIPNKSKISIFPIVPVSYLNHFIRGYFDGDGCIFLQLAKGKKIKTIIKKLSVIFTSGSKIFLEGLNFNIRKVIDLRQDKVYNSHHSYQLRYSTSDSIQLFKFLYKTVHQKNIYLRRKFKIFLKYFLLRPLKIDKDIKNILENLDYGHVAEKLTQRSAKPLTPVRFRPWPQSLPGWRKGIRTTLKMLRS